MISHDKKPSLIEALLGKAEKESISVLPSPDKDKNQSSSERE